LRREETAQFKADRVRSEKRSALADSTPRPFRSNATHCPLFYGALWFAFLEQYTLTVAKEGGGLLTELDASHTLNLMFIFGNARSGKSFMLNRLVGVPSLFKVINSSVPCTRGVDISSYIASPQALYDRSLRRPPTTAAPPSAPASPAPAPASTPATAATSGIPTPSAPTTPPPASAPQIGFVDVEGQGAEDGTYDTILALPLLLVSKVVLFNHKGAPTVSDMLSKLGVLARAADCVDIGKPTTNAKAGAAAGGAAGGKEEEEDEDEDEEESDTKKATEEVSHPLTLIHHM